MNTVPCPANSSVFFNAMSLTSQNRCVTRIATQRTQSVQNCMPTRSVAR
ncbi:hypothetical protein SAMN05444064_12955 [Pseudomonas syringae]|nr:hypothetical protein SAMN05444514_13055 [Pseudomonas syringae]SFM73798.1 hypothetical protein SAMN05444064_12955 [Pseudomonas syringae]